VLQSEFKIFGDQPQAKEPTNRVSTVSVVLGCQKHKRQKGRETREKRTGALLARLSLVTTLHTMVHVAADSLSSL